MTPADELSEQLDRAVGLLRSSRRAVAFTGAGISVPSGIPDFRSASTGLWQRFDPMQTASLTAFRNRPKAFYAWLEPLAVQILQAQPNPAHRALADLQIAGRIKTVITQNIDRLHQQAGCTDVIELHGNMDRLVCVQCGTEYPSGDFVDSWLNKHQLPTCRRCQSILKPDIVLYEEILPQDAWEQAERACEQADVILVAGTSLEVMPAASLPLEGFQRGAKLILINLSSTPLDVLAETVLPMDVSEGLPAICRHVLS